MVAEEGDVFRVPAGQKLRVSEVREEKIVLLNDKGMQKVYTRREFTSKVTDHFIIPEEDYEEVVREEVESEGPPSWLNS
jgi:hypothetical protein